MTGRRSSSSRRAEGGAALRAALRCASVLASAAGSCVTVVARNVTLTGSAPVVRHNLNLRTRVFPGSEAGFVVNTWRETTTAAG